MDAVELNTKRLPSAPSTVHLLPCKVHASGTAPVSCFFRPQDSSPDVDDTSGRDVVFRGRLLRGHEVTLPLPLQGVVFKEEAQADFGDDMDTSATDRTWVADSVFHSFTAWRHDTPVSHTDAHQRAFEWHAVAKALHTTQ